VPTKEHASLHLRRWLRVILSNVMIHIILLVDICSLSFLMGGCLNDTYQLLVFSDDNMLIETIHTLKRNTEALVAASKENATQNHNIKMGNKPFERLEQFKYLSTTLPS
jgi:hypothetical protein